MTSAMIRNLFIFIGTFVAGALIALVVRAARFQPHAEGGGHPPTADYAPMVSNVLAPAPAPRIDTTPAPTVIEAEKQTDKQA